MNFTSFNLVEGLGIVIFTSGLIGFLTIPLNLLFFAVSNELALLGLILLFASQSCYFLDMTGQVLILVLLVVSAVEMAILISLFIRSFIFNN